MEDHNDRLPPNTLRGELDSSTPRVFGVFRVVVFEG